MKRITLNGIDAEVAETFLERMKGLIGRRALPTGQGLLIPRCNAIHTLFMRFPIDATFLDRTGAVVKAVRNIRPGRLFVWGGWRARQVLETASRPAPRRAGRCAGGLARLACAALLAVAAFGARAEIQVINGVRYECADGLCRRLDDPDDAPTSDSSPAVSPTPSAASAKPTRWAQGYMDAEAFLAFLRGEETAPALPASTVLLLLTLLLAGAATNLTPCVLPMIPVNLIVIGRSVRRGLLYGLGIALAYGTLGVLAAVGGVSFGTIQSNPVFNLFVAGVFVLLGLALCGLFTLDLTRARRWLPLRTGALYPLFMGALSAVLAGACVAPVLVSVLLLTASRFAAGDWWALGLPFALGLGMALPWPFLGAGLNVLPKPGAWMKWVNRVFAVFVFGFAVWYAGLAVKGFARNDARDAGDEKDGRGVIDINLVSLGSLESLLSRAPSGKPVLVDCWATWCNNCAAMDRGTLREARVAEALKGYTVIRLQAEDLSELKRLPGFEPIQGLPAFVLFESGRERE